MSLFLKLQSLSLVYKLNWKSCFVMVIMCSFAPFFRRVILLCSNREPQPKKPRRSNTTGPKPHQLKTPTPKTQYKTPTLKPQTTINEQKEGNIMKNKPGKKYSIWSQVSQHVVVNLGTTYDLVTRCM